MCFRDSQDINYNRFWARLVLRLDIKLWTKIINQSGLFDAQGRSIPLECFFGHIMIKPYHPIRW